MITGLKAVLVADGTPPDPSLMGGANVYTYTSGRGFSDSQATMA